MDWSLIQKIATMNGWFYPSWYSWNANQIHQSLRRLLQPKRTTWVAPILPWDLKRFSLTPKKTLRPHTLSCPSKPGVNMLNIIESDDGKIHTGKPLINKCDGFQKKTLVSGVEDIPVVEPWGHHRESLVDRWGDEDIPPPGTVTEDLQVLSIPGAARKARALAARCWEDGRLNRFLGLLQWMFWGCCLEKYGNTMKHRKCLPSILLEEFDFRALNTEHWIKHSSPFTIYQRTMQQHIRLSQNSWKMSKISPKSMPYILYLYYSIKIYVPSNVPWQYTSQ